MLVDLDLVASDWEVCGEGARNVVLRYTGSHASLVRLRLRRVRVQHCCRRAVVLSPLRPAKQVGRVLRMPKRATGGPDACGDAAHARLDRQLWEHLPEYSCAAREAHKSWLFAAHVLLPLLGERGAAAGTLVAVPAEFVRSLSSDVAGGVAVDTDEGGRCVCVLLPDHSHFPRPPSSFAPPVVTVELKPKCGFLPQVLSAQQCAKQLVTRFEMHQRLKLERGQVSKARASSARAQPRAASPLTRSLTPAESVLSAGPVLARAATHADSASCALRCAAKQFDCSCRRQAGVRRRRLLWQSSPGEFFFAAALALLKATPLMSPNPVHLLR